MACLITDIHAFDDENEYLGYRVETTNGYVRVKIGNSACCCEDWGVNLSRTLNGSNITNMTSLIGTTIVGIHHYVHYDENERNSYVYVQINLTEDEEPLIITLWTESNGHYPHDCILDWDITIDGNKLTTHIIERI